MSLRLRVLPLRAALTALVTILLLTLLAVDVAYELWVQLPERVARQQEENAREQLHQIQYTLNLHYTQYRPDEAERSLAIHGGSPQINALAAVDEQGKIMTATQLAWKNRQAEKSIPGFSFALFDLVQRERRIFVEQSRDGNHFYLYAPLQLPHQLGEIRSNRFGVIFMEYDLARAEARAKSLILQPANLLRWLLTISFSLILLLLLLQRWFIAPLRYLERITDRLAAGEYGIQTQIVGSGELAKLAQHINVMSKDVRRTHSALTESENRLNFAVTGAGDGVWDWDLVSDKVFFSERWKTMLGYADAEIGDQPTEWLERLHPDDKEQCSRALDRHLRGLSDTYQCEHRLRCKDGSYKWILARGKVVSWDERNQAVRILGIHTDISALKQTQIALEEARRRAQQYLQVARVILIALNRAGQIELINPKGCEVLGLPEAQLLGMNWYERFIPEVQRDSIRSIGKQLMLGQIELAEYVENFIVTHSGEERLIAWHNSLLRDAEGGISGILSSGEDITEQRRAQRALELTRQRVITVLEGLDASVYVADMQTYELLYINRKVREETQAKVGDACWQVLQADQQGPCEFCTNQHLVDAEGRAKAPYIWEFKNSRLGRWFQCSDRAITWDDGRLVRLEVATDISERKAAEKRLRYQNQLEMLMVEISSQLLAAHNEELEGIIKQGLQQLGRLCQVERCYVLLIENERWMLNQNHYVWCADRCESAVTALAVLLRKTARQWLSALQERRVIDIPALEQLSSDWRIEHDILRAHSVQALLAAPISSSERLLGFVSMDMQRPRDWIEEEGRILRFLGNLIGTALERQFNEVALQSSRKRLEVMAYYDALTQLPNRRLLSDRMNQAMSNARRHKHLLAICYLDLDGFKPINDSLGHQVGDELLLMVAKRLLSLCRTEDTVARLGGDEFVFLLTGMESRKNCTVALERLVSSISAPYPLKVQTAVITASIGVTLYPDDNNDADTLLRHADQAMYLAKQQGRNRYHFFDLQEERVITDHQKQRQKLQQALQQQELRLFYQPKINMREGKVIGLEALLRWQHPQRGLLAPNEFLYIGEQTELLKEIDHWVLWTALEQLSDWKRGGVALRVSVNISAYSLQSENFIQKLRSMLEAHPDLEPGSLELEILETEAIRDLKRASAIIRACSELGVSFALDDFGTGYSSLTYFRHLPARVLKIDQSFVRNMLHDHDDMNIVEGVIGLAQAFQREVIAEGVETPAHGLMLLRLGCEQAQGYAIARPMPATQIPAWIKTYRTPTLWRSHKARQWAKDDWPLLMVEFEHMEWVKRLTASIQTQSQEDINIPNSHQCRFGHWYRTVGKKHYRHLPAFHSLGKYHEAIHQLAEELMKQKQSSPAVACYRLSELLALRDILLEELHELQYQIMEID